MKIVRFYGGLGNQMFQYAMLTALKDRWGGEVLMDTSLYATYGLHNGFELRDVFAVTAAEATPGQIGALSLYTRSYRLARLYHHVLPSRRTEFKERTFGTYYPEALECAGEMLYDGYWQHWEYFDQCRDTLLREFSLNKPLDARNAALLERLTASDSSVAIHVRRGDFLNKRLYRGLCGADYYMRAVTAAKAVVGNNADFFCFSNDADWCRHNLTPMVGADRLHVIDWNVGADSHKDMMLMSACRVNIIANSSFSWWAAYLNRRDDKAVIAPEKWINKSMSNPIQMPGWTLL